MVISGPKPDFSQIRGIAFNLTPITFERPYIQDVIQNNFPHFEESQTWSVSDRSQTMRIIGKVYEEIEMGGTSLSKVWVELISACASSGCKIFVWWKDAIGDRGVQKNLKQATDVRELLKIIMAQQGKDGNVCAYWEPNSSSRSTEGN